MPYEGEFAGYRALRRITETERVQQLLRRSRVYHASSSVVALPTPQEPPEPSNPLPDFVVAIDGSNAEVRVENGYGGVPIRVEIEKWRILPVGSSTTNRPPGKAAAGGMRHG